VYYLSRGFIYHVAENVPKNINFIFYHSIVMEFILTTFSDIFPQKNIQNIHLYCDCDEEDVE
jgi:hypothetical protein